MENEPRLAEIIHYKPSAFYYRRALRSEETTPEKLEKIVRSLRAELALCCAFARERSVPHQPDRDGPLFAMPADLDGLRSLGLRLCCELENVKLAIRDCGYIPPKKHIMDTEAHAKGWDRSG